LDKDLGMRLTKLLKFLTESFCRRASGIERVLDNGEGKNCCLM
jgi:hypothetical protein